MKSPKFSLRALLLFICLITSGFGLWWRWEPWVETHLLRLKNCYPVKACFSPNGKTILINRSDGYAEVWDTEFKKKLCSLGNGQVISSEFSPNGERILTCETTKEPWKTWLSQPGTVTLWDASTGSQYWTVGQYYDSFNGVFSAKGDRIVLSTGDVQAAILNAHTGKVIKYIRARRAIHSARYICNKSRIMTICDENTIFIWDKNAEKVLHNIDTSPHRSKRYEASMDGTLIVMIDSGVRLLTIESGESKEIYQPPIGPYGPNFPSAANGAVFTSDGKQLIISEDTEIVLFDIEIGKIIKRI